MSVSTAQSSKQPSNYQSYTLVVTLIDSEPEIWREIVVPSAIALQALHLVIQAAMGWENQHDYKFTQSVGKAACDPQKRLKDLIAETQPLYYSYDFQSGWLHRLEMVNMLDGAFVGCVSGKMACPPEGTGGVWGYDDFLDRLEDPEDPEYMMLIEKYSTFDPDVLDVQAANTRVYVLKGSLGAELGSECQPIAVKTAVGQTVVGQTVVGQKTAV